MLFRSVVSGRAVYLHDADVPDADLVGLGYRSGDELGRLWSHLLPVEGGSLVNCNRSLGDFDCVDPSTVEESLYELVTTLVQLRVKPVVFLTREEK